MKKLYGILFLLLVSTAGLYAQQDPHFTQYMFNYLNYNAAYAGLEGVTKMNAQYRNQWTGYAPTGGTTGSAPETQFISISTPIYTQKIGFGFMALNDKIGSMNRLDFILSGAYQVEIGDNKLSVGLRSGFISRGFDLRNLIFADPNDPIAQDETLAEIRPELGLGAFWQAEKYYVGISFNHLAKSSLSFGSAPFRTPLSTHGYAVVGYNQEVANRWIISPSVLLKTDLNTYSFDVGCVVSSDDDNLYGGVTWRESEAINLIFGYNVLAKQKDQWLRLSYSFDFVVTEPKAKQRTSHEFLLSYILPKVKADARKNQRTPRFQF